MASRGKNKCRRGSGSASEAQSWFVVKRKKARKNAKLIKTEKKRNRK